jgi:hypothetical protein
MFLIYVSKCDVASIEMDWNLAVERNHEALRRILAMLLALAGITGTDPQGDSRAATLPRHLHRFVLRLLRPAEAATRRLIIVAARGLAVKLPKPRAPKPQPDNPLPNRPYGFGIAIRPGMLPEPVKARVPNRSSNPSLSLLDPLKRFGVRRRYAKPVAMPQIRLLGDDGPIVPFFRRPETIPPTSPKPSPDDPLDAGRLHRRLDALRRALDDLPRQAERFARWRARRDAARAPARSGADAVANEAAGLPRGGEKSARRFRRIEPMRPGRPPGWRRKPDHDVYEVLNEVHGLAVWVRDGPVAS